MITFVSVHQIMRAEKLLADAGIKVLAIPTPREIDVSCGQCLLFDADFEAKVFRVLEEAKVQWSKLFSRDGKQRIYEKLREYKR